jgi:hypothetical protein
MDKLHEKLVSKDGWYAFWHIQKYHKHISWIIFGLVAIVFSSLLTGEIQKPGFITGLFSRAAVVAPELPRVYLNTSLTFTPVTGQTIIVPAGGNFQTALNNANLGDEIVLTAGATYTAPDGGFVLPNKTTGSGWITIRTSNMAGLPTEGTRVSPAHSAAMPKIRNSGVSVAFNTAASAHHYRLIGLDVSVPTTQNLTYTIMTLGQSFVPQTTLESVPHDIILDRMYVHGHATLDTQRCIGLNSARTSIIDSYISECHIEGFDAQAVAGWNGPGPFKIVNNYLEGSGENVMFGGADPAITNLVPSDIEFRHNYVAKPLAWYSGSSSYAGKHWSVKNLFELKNAQRILIDGNLFEHNWPDAQSGSSILFTVRSQDGACPWCINQDITFTNNILRSAASGMSMLGTDYIHPSEFTSKIKIANNVFEDIGGSNWPGSYGANMVMVSNPANAPSSNIIYDHNTWLQSGQVLVLDSEPFYGVVMTNNIVNHGSYGIFGSGKGEGNTSMAFYLPDMVYQKNVMIGGSASAYSNYPGNFYPANASEVGFTNYNNGLGGDYTLTPASPYKNAGTDGKDLGADIAALNAAIAGVVQGTGSGTPPPPPPPTTNKSHLSLNPSSVSFSAVSGDPVPAAKSVSLSNTGSGSSGWSATTNQSWCHVSPSSGTLASGGSVTLSVSVDDPSNIGTFSCAISLIDTNADNSPQSISVSYTVTPAPTPSATPSITSFSVSAKTATTVTIKWQTDQPTTGSIKYGLTKTGLSLEAQDTTLSTTHQLTLTGLSSKNTYYYQIMASNQNGSSSSITSSFRTKPR